MKEKKVNLMKYSIKMITYYLEPSCLKGKGNEKAYWVFFFFSKKVRRGRDEHGVIVKASPQCDPEEGKMMIYCHG